MMLLHLDRLSMDITTPWAQTARMKIPPLETRDLRTILDLRSLLIHLTEYVTEDRTYAAQRSCCGMPLTVVA